MSVVDGYVVASDKPRLGRQPDWVEIERNAVLIV